MAISGWYHAPTEPEDMDKASLAQLQQAKPKPALAPAVTSAPATAAATTETASAEGEAGTADTVMQDVDGSDGAAHVNGSAEVAPASAQDGAAEYGTAEDGTNPEANPLQAGQDNFGVDEYLPFTGM
jgi:hypothetical protein